MESYSLQAEESMKGSNGSTNDDAEIFTDQPLPYCNADRDSGASTPVPNNRSTK